MKRSSRRGSMRGRGFQAGFVPTLVRLQENLLLKSRVERLKTDVYFRWIENDPCRPRRVRVNEQGGSPVGFFRLSYHGLRFKNRKLQLA